MKEVSLYVPKGENLCLALNIIGCVVLAGLAAYDPHGVAGGKGWLGDPGWAAPLEFMVFTLLFTGDKFRTPKHTLLNIALMVLCGILLLIPLPPETANSLKWWYPLGAGLIVNIFISLD